MRFPSAAKGTAMNLLVRVVAAASLAATLPGCVAAPALLTATSAVFGAGAVFGVYKVVQVGTGGGAVEVRFEQPLPAAGARATAGSIRKIAVWPVADSSALLAERLARQPALTVISPARLRELMADRKEALSLKGLLEQERTELFALACRRAAADAVYFAQSTGSGQNISAFSFDRPSQSVTFRHGLHDCRTGGFRLLETGQVAVKLGGSMPDSGEIERAANGVIAERLIEFLGA